MPGTGHHSYEVITLKCDYTDLISLIAQNREAMAYFKKLPDHIKCELSKKADQISSFDSLKKFALHIKNKG